MKVRFGNHISGGDFLQELGLALGEITVHPNFYHKGIHIDDYGPNCPAEILWQLASCDIRMNLIHFDNQTLSVCLEESMAGSNNSFLSTLMGAGNTLGHGLPFFASGNHFISLNLINGDPLPLAGFVGPIRFRTSYLTAPPLEIPLGTDCSVVLLNWQAIPYQPVLLFQVNADDTDDGDGGALGFDTRTSGEAVLKGGGPDAPFKLVPKELQSSGTVLWDFNIDLF